MNREEINRRLAALNAVALMPTPALDALTDVVYKIAEEAYVEGKEMQRKLLRLNIGLAVPDDMKG